MFHVGQKVVCVRDEWITLAGESTPKAGVIYTIRNIEAADAGEDGVYLQLVEIVNAPRPYIDGHKESAFWSLGFRPVVERKTDISVFTEMLKTAPETVPA